VRARQRASHSAAPAVPGPYPSRPQPWLTTSIPQLNLRVQHVVRAQSVEEVAAVIRAARGEGRAVSIAGGMHAMGGQQFGTDTVLLDTRSLNRVKFDTEKFPPSHRPGDTTWRKLLSDLSSLGHAQAGRIMLSAVSRVSPAKEKVRSGGALPERLVSSL
jgi:FAD binding domain